MKHNLFSILFLLSIAPVFGQTSRLFRVEDSVSYQPVIAATIPTTTKLNAARPIIGAVTDVNGLARITDIPATVATLRVSAVGYETENFPIKAVTDTLIFRLKDAVEAIDEIIVSATRTNSRIEDLPIKVEVLGMEDMNEESAVVPGNISSILGDISIIHIQRTSAVNGNHAIRMQGLDPKYTQILHDGLPLYEGFSGNLGVLQIPPLDLKQIEIVKGSVSTLYGGGAIGGMINIVSKTPHSTIPEFTALLNRSNLKETNLNAYYP